MVMQQLSFHDDVTVNYTPLEKSGSFDIEVRTNRYYLPADRRNLAYQAAELMARDERAAGSVAPGKILINIKKRIPVAGGLAGGSGNAAAVLHALNVIWDLHLSLKELMDLGAELGSDVPFCVMGQARANKDLPDYLKNDPMAASCARATGRGTDLEALPALKTWIVIAKPRFSVSTKEVYEGIDGIDILSRPDNDRLAETMRVRQSKGLKKDGGGVRPTKKMYADFINVLELYTLDAYPEVRELKETMKAAGAEYALMSGSGPTVFGIFKTLAAAKKAARMLQYDRYTAYWTKTML